MSPATVLRFLSLVSYLCLVLPVMWGLTWLRLIHGLLRKAGLPNRWLPLDVISSIFCRGVLILSGVEVDVRGRSNVPRDVTIFMPNHASGLDPFLVTGTAPMNPVFVFKRELMFYFPPIFLLGYIYGHIPISRSKRDSAINSLSKAAKKISKYHRCVCIFPEGTRSQNGHLLPLKSGPFYMAQDAKVAVTPVYIKGALDLMAKGQLLPTHPGVVTVEYQRPIAYRGQDHEALKKEVEQSLKEAEARWEGKKQRAGGYSLGWCLIPIALHIWSIILLWRRIW